MTWSVRSSQVFWQVRLASPEGEALVCVQAIEAAVPALEGGLCLTLRSGQRLIVRETMKDFIEMLRMVP